MTGPEVPPESAAAARRTVRRRVGIALLAAGLLTIVVAVVAVLEIANGPGTGPKSFAQRRSYDQVKVAVHRSFPLALVVALGGLGLAMAGAHLLGGDADDAGVRTPPEPR